MSDVPGLRERKKRRTHLAISEAAIALFLEHGFDQVSVTQVAEAAEVSRRTLFAYFPTKEDLVVHRFADHEGEAARVVRGRPPGTGPLEALRAHHLDALDRHDPMTGLNDRPDILALYRMLAGTPALVGRLERFKAASEAALAEALRDTAGVPPLTARLAAVQIVAVQWALALDNREHMVNGMPAHERLPAALGDTEHAFTLLKNGLGALTGDS
ncbi:TetR/AcrR family transcriptional regulator [Sphaerisporangium fuscum]|uniref:TetR/AcrR family transcriptional regulator n=1 Tax=Sphaerisporangium fuscum TaxID=2835868 RepID=UPI001BDC4D61|nr:TetR family transcriptional regulator [Sphaerisporangium fuscum]